MWGSLTTLWSEGKGAMSCSAIEYSESLATAQAPSPSCLLTAPDPEPHQGELGGDSQASPPPRPLSCHLWSTLPTSRVLSPGQSGLGKSTLINTLFKSKISRKSVQPTSEERIPKTIEIKSITHGESREGTGGGAPSQVLGAAPLGMLRLGVG